LVWGINILSAVQAENRVGETFYWGLSQSPLVEGERVIVCPGGSRSNSVIGIDKRSGRVMWTGGAGPPGYGSPIAVTLAGQKQVVCVGGQSLMAFEPASGQPLWRAPFGNKFNCNCATPVVADNRIFYSAAYGTGATLIDVNHVAGKWSTKPK